MFSLQQKQYCYHKLPYSYILILLQTHPIISWNFVARSSLFEGSTTKYEEEIRRQDGGEVKTDEDDEIFFDTKDCHIIISKVRINLVT